MRKRVAEPDNGDALALTFAEPLNDLVETRVAINLLRKAAEELDSGRKTKV